MPKLLITGASGFLGWNLCQQARSQWETHGTYSQNSIEISDVRLHQIDLTQIDAVTARIDAIAPDAIIHTAAAASPNFCQTYPELSARINIGASQLLAKICAQAKIPFVFTSTDLVFDGKQAPYLETDPVSPLNIYGEQKVAAELKILATYPQATICRMPLMFGMAPPTASSFLQPWLTALASQQTLQLFIDEFRTPVSAATATRGLLMALRKSPGILNLGGKERLSRYEFGQLLAEVFGFDSSLLLPISQRDLTMAAPRAADVSLDSTKAISLGYELPPLRQELESLRLAINSDR
ncbi:SDR family oxidoreductase [Chamaesiphon polymorphus]|uniref:NAD(P)-dependent oxidoreductase n=1 Tax=Chamaesiphon polymorphus CCALA 037 TaxID=2107692 RepID=A0A2T1GGM2_9CYAN|nr:NAD(P)-dependent oxidoreductase [Chamaesiphon polymorphus]PSB56802.1 NAD(P)-dependent oxidoreductase [Chamaesiphon polymorphus CCALA 037]